MRISDWSSDVCSSDLDESEIADTDNDGVPDSSDDSDARNGFANTLQADAAAQSTAVITAITGVRLQLGSTARTRSEERRVGKEVRVALGGRRNSKNKQRKKKYK